MADLSGTSGNDTFVYAARSFGTDTITGFEIGKDKLDLSAFHVATVAGLRPYMAQLGPDVVITLGYGYKAEQITLANTDLAALLASPGSFVLNTSQAALTVDGTVRADVLFGGLGADTLHGDHGDDQLNGGGGDDRLTGGSGDDLLRGGGGKDIFIYDGRNFEADTIVDFTIGQDRIDLSALHLAGLASLKPYMAQVGADVEITLGFGYTTESITLTNTRLSDLLASPASFVFNTLTDALTVEGTARADILFGGLGADRLLGGTGDDQLNGVRGPTC